MKKHCQDTREDGFDKVYLKALQAPNLFILNQNDQGFVTMEHIVGKLIYDMN